MVLIMIEYKFNDPDQITIQCILHLIIIIGDKIKLE